MPTIDELLSVDAQDGNEEVEVYKFADGYERSIYHDNDIVSILNKSIGDTSRQISVSGEANSQYIVFERERYVDNIDLNDKILQVHYERPDGAGGNSRPVNVEISENHIRFGWIIPAKAVELDGILKVMPFAYGVSPKGDSYVLKDLYIEYQVHEGLAVSGGIDEPDEDWYLHFVKEMQGYVEEAKTSETNSKVSETNAKASETLAAASAEAAASSLSELQDSETNAAVSAEKAKASETKAKASETAAKTSETNAANSATAAASSESTVAANATNAKASEIAAKSSETNAKNSETNSKTSETNSKASEINAKNSETNAATSETNAAISAESAANRATDAAASSRKSESWAVGGTNTRQDEDVDNSKYYSEMSKSSSDNAKIFADKAAEAVNNAADKIKEAAEMNIPEFQIDFATGHLMYQGGRFGFLVNEETGHLQWEVA